MQRYFANFIKTANGKTADPNGPGLPVWPKFETGQRLVIDVNTRAENSRPAAGARGIARWVLENPKNPLVSRNPPVSQFAPLPKREGPLPWATHSCAHPQEGA